MVRKLIKHEFFYTKDGKLFYRVDDTRFSDCIYEAVDYKIP